MNEFTTEEIEGIVRAMSQEAPEKGQIPLLPPGSYSPPARVAFTPIEGEKPRPLEEPELSDFAALKAHIEVVYGRARIPLATLASLEKGSLLPLDELCDDLVEIYANGSLIGRGELVSVEGKYGVKIVTFTKNP